MVQVIPVVDHPGRIFAFGGQIAIIFQGWDGPGAAVQEMIDGGSINSYPDYRPGRMSGFGYNDR